MEAIGGLIIFFSWVITNSLVQKFTSLKQSLETAQGNYALYDTLFELRSMLNSVGLELIQGLPKGINATRFRAGTHHVEGVEVVRQEFNVQVLSAHQVRELNDFIQKLNRLAETIGGHVATKKEVHDHVFLVQELYEGLQEYEQRAEQEMWNSNEFEHETDFSAVPTYLEYYRETVLPKVHQYYAKAVELSNIVHEEGREALDNAKRNSRIGKWLALAAYAVGTTMVLSSKILGVES